MTSKLEHPDEFYAPEWSYQHQTPIVDGKLYDPKTGSIRQVEGEVFVGPPAVDIVVVGLHADSGGATYRCQRSFPMVKLLQQMTSVITKRNLEIDSITATPFAIRLILAHALTSDEFDKVALEIANGIWDLA